ncbi:MAG: hypothetical protein II877_00245 [Synergistaceae bacterium]|nr:hypothetical protein [Synergistaceae bacterium]
MVVFSLYVGWGNHIAKYPRVNRCAINITEISRHEARPLSPKSYEGKFRFYSYRNHPSLLLLQLMKASRPGNSRPADSVKPAVCSWRRSKVRILAQ